MEDKLLNNAAKLDQGKTKVISIAKNRIFDLLSMFLILGMVALCLGVVELRKITFEGILNIFIEIVPFYLSAMLLSLNNYTKGTYDGKASKAYMSIVELYSTKINHLTGEMLANLAEFCVFYNDKALRTLQTSVLKKVAISYERFNDFTIDNDGNEVEPLKVLSEKKLKTMYSSEVVRVIKEAKRCKIKCINTNILLGNTDALDATDLGPGEKELARKRTGTYAAGYVFSILSITLISIRNISDWGWAGIFFVIFKMIYIAAAAYMKYFQGYKDITSNVLNHISRKCEILDEYDYWYSSNIKV